MKINFTEDGRLPTSRKMVFSREPTVILRNFSAEDDLSRFTVDAEVTITFASTLSFLTRDN